MQHGFEFKTLGFDFFIIAQIDSEKRYRIMSVTVSACNLLYGVQLFSLDLPDLIQNQPAIYNEIQAKLKDATGPAKWHCRKELYNLKQRLTTLLN